MKKTLIVLVLALSFVLVARADEPLNLAVLPTTKIGHSPWWAPENYWLDRINRQLRLIAESDGRFDLVFIGDSITHNWEGWPEDQWQKIIARPGALKMLPAGNSPGKAALDSIKREFTVLNLGIGGDTTGEVIWRLRYGGQLKGYEAKSFCLMIGTNNREKDPRAIAEGIRLILQEIQKQQPRAVVFLLPIFPCGERPEDPARLRNAAVNRIIEGFADGKKVVWVDFSKRFLQADGTLSRSMMPDLLHPSAAGYAIWAEELLPYVKSVCQSETETKDKDRKDMTK